MVRMTTTTTTTTTTIIIIIIIIIIILIVRIRRIRIIIIIIRIIKIIIIITMWRINYSDMRIEKQTKLPFWQGVKTQGFHDPALDVVVCAFNVVD